MHASTSLRVGGLGWVLRVLGGGGEIT
jgi:hypothetical protein